MAKYYLDTSALFKRYALEKGSSWVKTIFRQSNNLLIVTRIVHPEIASALARRVREGTLSSNDQVNILRTFNYHLRNRLWIIEAEASICANAALLVQKHPLRAYDSVQLATALHMNTLFLRGNATGITFLSSDTRLLTVATAEGLATDNPENH